MQHISFPTQATLHFVERGEPLREKLENHIHGSFARAYGADINHFLPTLIGLEGAEGEMLGAMGLAPAANHPLFLEQYLDGPIEQVLERQLANPSPRSSIVELGNLAAGSPGAARLMIICLTAYLRGAGFDWVVFTAVPALCNAFLRMGLQLEDLVPADGQRLGPDLKRWGSYYDQQPVVAASNVRQAFERLQHHLEMEQALALFQELWQQALTQGERAGSRR